MLKVTNRDYEIEEKVQLTKLIDGKEQIIYEFQMNITENEMQEIKHILFDFSNANISKYMESDEIEKKKLEKEAEKNIKSNEERFIDICFKEHKEKFKELAGEYKFEEMIEEIKGYLMGFFMEKQISQMNIPITNLTKIMNNLQKFR